MRQHYTEEEANEILQRAVERQVGTGGMSRDQLLKLATEIGVSPEALDRAEAEWSVESQERGLQKAFNEERRGKWRVDLLTYIATCTFLALLNRAVSPWFFWAIFPILGMGLRVVLDAIKVHHPVGEEYEREFQNWLEKREKRPLPSGEPGPYPYARP